MISRFDGKCRSEAMDDVMLKVSHLKKEYKLGRIGGTTLREAIQEWSARRCDRADAIGRIGASDNRLKGTFLALDDVSLEVRKGERVGIIGHNGAGKSTLLKLISRITAPTEGDIWIDGSVASMLEVGTGFHGELTGRENIYLNGAILGMKKKEIDTKIEDIIEFSECRQFIDTPVKRYSSGMYVKLAFSVISHLDADVMIMDEVLAVGDMAFQKKCLDKMNDVSKALGRTILYVSHNMNTIRQLCERCIVLDHGKVIFDGDVEESIDVYMGTEGGAAGFADLTAFAHESQTDHRNISMTAIQCLGQDTAVYPFGSVMRLRLDCVCKKDAQDILVRVDIKSAENVPVTMVTTDRGVDLYAQMKNSLFFDLDISWFVPGHYLMTITLYEKNRYGQIVRQDRVREAFAFEVRPTPGFNNNMLWKSQYWGYVYSKPIGIRAEIL